MSYESIAEVVHNLVKKTLSQLPRELGLSSADLETNESTILQEVFSKYETTGDVLSIRIIPESLWG